MNAQRSDSPSASSNPTPSRPGGMPGGARLLIAAIVIMGVLIFAGLVLIGLKLSGALEPAAGEQEGAPGGFGQVGVVLPEGCEVAEATLSEGALLLRISGLPERGCPQLVILDAATGKESGRVTALRP